MPQVTAVTGRAMKYWHNKATTPTCRQGWSFPTSNNFPPSVVGWASLNTSDQNRALAVPIFVKMLSKEASFPDIPLYFSGSPYICPSGAVGCSRSETFSYRFPVKEITQLVVLNSYVGRVFLIHCTVMRISLSLSQSFFNI